MKLLFKNSAIVGLKMTLLTIVSILFMFMDHRSPYFQRFQQNMSVVVAPLQYLVNTPVEFVQWMGGNFVSQQQAVQENAQLRAQQLMLQAKLQRLAALENENAQLRALLQSSPHMDGEVTMARLLAVNMDPFVQKVILDKGQSDRIFVGQPVLDAYGLMGQVVKVGPLTSQVLLVTDPQSAISVQDSRNGVRAVAAGRGDGLQLINLADATDVQVGDLMVTTGLDQRFPQGYPVGTVKEVKRDPEFRFATVTMEPSAQINGSVIVLLVWPTPSAVAAPADTTTPTAASPSTPAAAATPSSPPVKKEKMRNE